MTEKTSLYAWVVREADGQEGPIAAAVIPEFGPVVLVTTRPHLAEMMAPFAQLHADASGLPVRLVRFDEVEEVRRL